MQKYKIFLQSLVDRFNPGLSQKEELCTCQGITTIQNNERLRHFAYSITEVSRCRDFFNMLGHRMADFVKRSLR